MRSLYATLFRISSRTSWTRASSLLFSNFNTIVLFIALYSVYSTAFASGGLGRAGLSFENTMWSMGMYSLYWSIGFRFLFRDVQDDVNSGVIEVRVTKPYQYLLYKAVERFGKAYWIFLWQACVLFVLFMTLVGFPQLAFSPATFFAFATLFCGGVILGFSLYILIGLVAFWLEDATPVFWIFDKGTMILGGAYLPVVLLPPTFRAISQYSPQGAILSCAQVFSASFLNDFWLLFLAQLGWSVVVIGTIMLVWNRAMRKLSVNGG